MPTKLFVALDCASADEARALYKKIRPIHDHFKIGLELFCASGPDFVKELTQDGAKIFLDLKFHDIPNTVSQAVARAAALQAGWINLHLSGGEEMVRKSVEALRESAVKQKHKPSLIGVTVLTSMNEEGLAQVGVRNSVASQVQDLAQKGKAWGLDGVVCSAHELANIQKACGKDFITIVPGIRPEGAATQDQKRVMTPQEATQDGAHFIVVGRPISQAKDPREATQKILSVLL